MPIFRYKGFKSDGSKTSGILEADGIGDAVRILREKGFYSQDVHEELSRKGATLFLKREATGLNYITRQIAILLSSGVPLIDAIRSLAEQRKGYWRNILVGIRDRLAGGSSFSRAMEDYPDVFPEYYINMVYAGETGGGLDTVLENLADFLESQEEIKSQVRSASIYPLFMFLVGTVVLFFIFIFVVPKITKVFEDSAAALPLITVLLIKISYFFHYYWWLVLILFAGMWYGLKILIHRNDVFYGSLLYRIPILNTLYIARFLRIIGFLLNGRVPMLKALQLSAKSVGNNFLQRHILETEKNIAEGATLSSSLRIFPPVVRQIIATGEKGGILSEILLKAAESYEKEFAIKVKRYLTMLEPVMILSMGLIIGFIVFAVLLPIFEINQLIR